MGVRSKKVKVNVGADKVSVQTRVDRSKAVGVAAPDSPIYQGQSGVKAACDTYVERGVRLAAADAAVQVADLAAAKAHSARDAEQADHDAAYDLYVANVERHAGTPEAVQGLGLTVLTRASYAITPPVEIRARYSPEKSAVFVHVTPSPGLRTCVVEVSHDAAEPRSWERLPGVGSRHVLKNLPPGTHWLRAAHVRATEQSAFTAPVAVTVR